MNLHAFACEPGWEFRVIAELANEFPGNHAAKRAAGWVEMQSQADPPLPCLALAAQGLPHATPIRAESIRDWIAASVPRIIEGLHDHCDRWRLHVFSILTPSGTAGPRRCELIRNGIVAALKRKQKRLLPLLTTDCEAVIETGEALVQIGLIEAVSGFLSILSPAERRRWRRVVVRFPGGRVDIPEDKKAPSRAHRKLHEALVRMGSRISAGDTCVDLGASPGGWTHVATAAGANVIAVDRAPLADKLMNHAKVRFIRADAFAYEPPTTVDWLLSDVVAFPDRVLELLDRWLVAGRCRRFVVTIKFRGDSDDAALQDVKRLLERRATDFEIRRLNCNKNEATAFGIVE